jgi:plasmid stabilization system protein ParE
MPSFAALGNEASIIAPGDFGPSRNHRLPEHAKSWRGEARACRLEAALNILTSFPNIGVVQQRNVRKYILPRFPYLIYYSIADREQEIRIVTIRHTARRPFLTL